MSRRRVGRRLAALVMVALLAMPAIPVLGAGKATITITEATLTAARSSAGTEVNGITYIKGNPDPGENYVGYCGNGVFKLNPDNDYKLGEDISLEEESFIIEGESKTIKLDMAGKTLAFKDWVAYCSGEDENNLPLLDAVKNNLEISGDGCLKHGGKIPSPSILCKDLDIENGEFDGQILTTGLALIEDGVFHGPIHSDDKAIIYDGTFDEIVYVEKDLVVTGGTFKGNCVSDSAEIEDGTFNELSIGGDSVIRGGKFDCVEMVNQYNDVVPTLTIDGGDFTFTGDNVAVSLRVLDANVVLNGGTFINKNKSTSALWTPAVEIWGDRHRPSVKINGGTFISGDKASYAVLISDAADVYVGGGTFEGYTGGLAVFSSKNYDTDISLGGGVFRTTGSGDGKKTFGGITVGMPIDRAKDSYDASFFEAFLAEGKAYSPAVEVNCTEKSEKYSDFGVYTQKEIAVVNAAEEADEDVREAAKSIIDELVTKGKAEGVDPALAEAIIQAVAQGKKIEMELVVKEAKAEDVGEDAGIITKNLPEGKTIGGYLVIDFAVSIDGEHAGTISNAGRTLKFKVEIPGGLPAVARGKVRKFTVFRVHEGVMEELPTSQGDGYLESESALYSTFVITYEDVVKSPATGDNTPIWLFGTLIIMAGAAGAVEIKRRKIKAV